MLIDLVNRKAGPVQSIDFGGLTSNHLGNCSVSSLSTHLHGNLVIKASGTPEVARVYKYGTDLVIWPHLTLVPRLSHADTGVTLDGRDVWVGGVRDASATGIDKDRGRIVAVDLETGEFWHVSAGRASGKLPAGMKECADEHCSCRGREGYVVTSYYASGGEDEVYVGEVVEWPLDGSRVPRRFGAHRSTGDPYRAEVHPAGLPDGRVMIASNWAGLGADPASPTSDCKAYVVELLGELPPPADDTPDDPPPPAPGPRYVLDPGAWQFESAVKDSKTGQILAPIEIARRLNLVDQAVQP
jgi:hypothetical protein